MYKYRQIKGRSSTHYPKRSWPFWHSVKIVIVLCGSIHRGIRVGWEGGCPFGKLCESAFRLRLSLIDLEFQHLPDRQGDQQGLWGPEPCRRNGP